MSHNTDDDDVTTEEQYGSTRINPDALDNSYEYLSDEKNLKAKVWDGDDERRLYLRVRDHENGRKFNEYTIPLADGSS